MEKLIPVVIPVFGREDVFATVERLRAQAYASQLRFVVIDNGNAAELSGQYVGVPIHIHPAVGASITGSTETGKAVTLSQEITGEGWFMLAWDGTTATLYAYAGIPGIDGGDIDPQQE